MVAILQPQPNNCNKCPLDTFDTYFLKAHAEFIYIKSVFTTMHPLTNHYI